MARKPEGCGSCVNSDYPGLTTVRRVVLDLAFAGYGLSSQIVGRGGELLGIADPAAKFDPVPGAVVARIELGQAKLAAGGSRFDLIVADIPQGATCAAVGEFAPPPKLSPPGTRRILGTTPTAPKPPPARTRLEVAVWHATHILLSERGEALLRMHVTAVNALFKVKAPGLRRLWWGHLDGEYVYLYLRADFDSKGSAHSPFYQAAPTALNRNYKLRDCSTKTDWTSGQLSTFQDLRNDRGR